MELRRGWNDLGESVEGRSIRAFANADLLANSSVEGQTDRGGKARPGWTLLIGGTHGDELATVAFLETFIKTLAENAFPAARPIVVLPVLNPDGLARTSRYNARGVDLNRNLPVAWNPRGDEPSGPEPLSEPETRLLHDLLTLRQPARIVSLHWALGELDPDGLHSAPLAKNMWESLSTLQRQCFRLRAPSLSSMPGSLGSFCLTLNPSPALVTLELPYHPQPDEKGLPENHLQVVHTLWREEQARYEQAVYPAVETMLRMAAKG